jgi:hypothetical protein
VLGSKSSGDRLSVAGETLFLSRYLDYKVNARLK